jgi:hypothetical protein
VNSSNTITLIDSHVHIYDCFDIAALLDAAHRNFAKVAGLHGSENFSGILLLSETAKDHWFERLVSYANTAKPVGDWRFGQHADDSCVLSATRSDQAMLHIVAGRQVITGEKIEVLALATRALFDDGQPLSTLLKEVNEKDGLAVLPWAVGKWLGARSRLIRKILDQHNEPAVLLGDNSGRPLFWRNPRLFQRARALGIPILPGTDPLPLPWEVDRVGRFGFILRQPLAAWHPSQALKQILRQRDVKFETYGALDRPDRFLRNQIALRCGR